MRILFLTDNFPPEYNAPATRTYEHCREWVQMGATVTVITCFPNFPQGKVFPGYKNRWRQVEYINGIKVIRVWSYISPNQGSIKRIVDFVSFGMMSFIHGLWINCDIIVATSPQFFTAISGCALSIVKRKKWCMEVRDLWPESIKTVGAIKSGRLINFLEKIELFLYRRSQKVIVVTDSFKENLIKRGIPENKIYVIKNGVDLSIYRPKEKSEALTNLFQLKNKFVFGYVGTHGLAHGLDFIVKSLNKLTDRSIHFIFIGDGAEKRNLVELAKSLNLNSVTFIDPVPKREIQEYLSIIDVSLVPLRKSITFESVIPSKIFESVAMNIPLLIGVNGEARSIVEFYKAGLYFEPENETDFLEKVSIIKKDLEGDNPYIQGCDEMANDFDRKNLAGKMLEILTN